MYVSTMQRVGMESI